MEKEKLVDMPISNKNKYFMVINQDIFKER